jgi:beta-phosphoglucomutase-like phosphatase (HAD superfamily)
MSKIKGVIFDLDGVLVDTKKIHHVALNNALKNCKIGYQISINDHIKIYDQYRQNIF